MNVKSVEKLEKSRVALTIEVDAQEFEAAIAKAYKKQRGKIMVPGFRKGHAPRKIVEKMYGANVFYDDAINESYPEAYAKALEQEKVDAVAYPEVELKEVSESGYTFVATVAVKPPVTLGEYKGLAAPKEEAVVSDSDVNDELQQFIARATTVQDVDREAKQGDIVNFDFKGFTDGKAFEGGAGEKFDLELGSGQFIPGFEEQLIGVKAGDEKDVEVTFPEQYHAAELAGKPATFKCKIHTVKEKVLPTVDDEFAKDVSEFETLAELKANIEKKILTRKESAIRHGYEESLLTQVIDNMTAEIPDAMVNERVDRMMEEYAQRITAQGIPFEQYLQMTGMTTDMLRGQATAGALRQTKIDLALEAIGAAEKLEISDEDIDAEINDLAELYHMDVDKVRKVLPMEDIRKDLMNRKAAAFVFENGKVGPAPEKKEAEEKPKKKTAAKKTTKKADEVEGEEKPKKKPAAKKTTKKAEKTEEKPEEKTEE